MHPPLLALAMIVKDEARTLGETLASVRPWIDAAAVVDTGSTDGTRELAAGFLEGLPGGVSEATFEDFAQARNVALARAEATGAAFVLMLSGDELLETGGLDLRAFCAARRGSIAACHYVRVRQGGHAYDSARLTRTGGAWRYRGRTHEVLRGPAGELRPDAGGGSDVVRVPGAGVLHKVRRDDPSARLARDAAWLVADMEDDPDDPRAPFMLAQTHEGQRRYPEAVAGYRWRSQHTGGWREERYEATFRLARLLDTTGDPSADDAYYAAVDLGPDRAEPHYYLAWRLLKRGDLAGGREHARRAAALPYPDAWHHMVEWHVYEHAAARLREYADGLPEGWSPAG